MKSTRADIFPTVTRADRAARLLTWAGTRSTPAGPFAIEIRTVDPRETIESAVRAACAILGCSYNITPLGEDHYYVGLFFLLLEACI